MVLDLLSELLIGLVFVSMFGRQISEFAHAAHGIANRVGVLPERWENPPYPNQRVFPRFMDTVLEKSSIDSKTMSPLSYYVGLGAVVTGLAVVFETSLIALSTGGAILAHQTLGVTPDLVGIYQQIVIVTVLLTIAAMTNGTQRLQQDPVR